MSEHTIKPLSVETWPAFEALAEKHNGVWGGCWDSWFHGDLELRREIGSKEFKRRRVEEGRATSALVFDGDQAIGWCQYGTPEELSRINHVKEWEAGLVERPNYRITCFFIDRDHRNQGVAREGLDGALQLIAESGGGLVEAYPHDTHGEKKTASFLHSATRSMFEQAGFVFERTLGTQRNLMKKTVKPA